MHPGPSRPRGRQEEERGRLEGNEEGERKVG